MSVLLYTLVAVILSTVNYSTVQYCIVLEDTVLYCTVNYSTVQYCIVLEDTILYCMSKVSCLFQLIEDDGKIIFQYYTHSIILTV